MSRPARHRCTVMRQRNFLRASFTDRVRSLYDQYCSSLSTTIRHHVLWLDTRIMPPLPLKEAVKRGRRVPSTLFFRNCNEALKRGGVLGGMHFPHDYGVAFFIADTMYAAAIGERHSIPWRPDPNPSLDSLKRWVKEIFHDSNPEVSDYDPGTAYKRIWRPLACLTSLKQSVETDKQTQAMIALRIQVERMEQIFQTVEPTGANIFCYGHRVRELLLLACMEVESSWKAVLRANEYKSSGRLTTTDYVKLLPAMLLDCYTISLRSYPDFPAFSPFDGWDAAHPTQSLGWYAAYNRTKHDREENLNAAGLQQAIHAVGAVVVMLQAQFGPQGVDSGPVRSMFRVSSDYSRHPHSCYIPRLTRPLRNL